MDLPGNPVTDATGTASALVDCGWSGTIRPQKECYVFSNLVIPPVTQNVSFQVGGTLRVFPLYGRITDASTGAGIDGVTMSGFPSTAVVTANGGYYTTTVDCKWSGTVTPVKSCTSFAPASFTYQPVQSSITQNFTGTVRSTAKISGNTYYSGGTLPPQPSDPLMADVTLEGFPALLNPNGVKSNSAGHFEAFVPCGWSGTITARKECYRPGVFSIPSVTSDTTKHFNLYTASILISGSVKTADGTGVQGVKINGVIQNGQPLNIVTGADGSFGPSLLTCPWTGTISAELACYSFSPSSRSFNNATSEINLVFTATHGRECQY